MAANVAKVAHPQPPKVKDQGKELGDKFNDGINLTYKYMVCLSRHFVDVRVNRENCQVLLQHQQP